MHVQGLRHAWFGIELYAPAGTEGCTRRYLPASAGVACRMPDAHCRCDPSLPRSFVTIISWIPGHGASYLGSSSVIPGGHTCLLYGFQLHSTACRLCSRCSSQLFQAAPSCSCPAPIPARLFPRPSTGGEQRLDVFKQVVAAPSLSATGLAWDWSAFKDGRTWLVLFTFL